MLAIKHEISMSCSAPNSTFYISTVKHQLGLTVPINPKLAQEHCAQRLCTRMRGVPLHNVGIVVQVLNYALFNWVYKDFAVNDGMTKLAPLGARAKQLLGSNTTKGMKKGTVVVREQRVARIDRGRALLECVRLHDVNFKRGYSCSKKLKGNDFSVLYELTATYMLKVNRKTCRVVEECHLKMSTVNVLSGTTIAWSNTQRVGNEGCLSQEERDAIAKIAVCYPKKANFHLLQPGTPDHDRVKHQGRTGCVTGSLFLLLTLSLSLFHKSSRPESTRARISRAVQRGDRARGGSRRGRSRGP